MDQSYLLGFIGGCLIGVAVVLLWWLNGKTLGVSGIVSNLFKKPFADNQWRWAFVLGLMSGGYLYGLFNAVEMYVDVSWGMIMLAGLLVGVGTVLSNGCTSGHGICGLARFSKRSIVATVTFMLTGILMVMLKKAWGI